jgi:hypothetical protein
MIIVPTILKIDGGNTMTNMEEKILAGIAKRYSEQLKELIDNFNKDTLAVCPNVQSHCHSPLRVQYGVDEPSEDSKFDFTTEWGTDFYSRIVDGVEFVEVVHKEV